MSDDLSNENSTNDQSLIPICEEVRALMPAYALGALDAGEERLVEQYLDRCPDARATLAEYLHVADNLLLSASPVSAPPHLAARLEAALNDEQWSGRDASAAQRSTQTENPPLGRRLVLPVSWRWIVNPLMALLLLALLIATNIYWSQQVEELRQEQQTMARNMYEQESVLVLMGAGNAHRVELPPASEEASQAQAAVVYDPERTRAFLYVDRFPALPEDQIYQLWLIRGNVRISGGVFDVNRNGAGTLYINAPDPLGTYDAIGITPEPAGGSESPTAPPVVRGGLQGLEMGD